MFYNVRRKRAFRIDLLFDPVRQEYIAVITGIPVQDVPDLLRLRFFCIFKTVIHLDKKLIQDGQIIHPVFKSIRDAASRLRAEQAQQLSHFQAQLLRRIGRVGIVLFIMIFQQGAVQNLIQTLLLLQAVSLPAAIRNFPPDIFQFKKKNRNILKINQILLRNGLFSHH